MPHSFEAEQMVLGGLMLDSTAWFKVADKVTPEDFYRAAHRLVYQAMIELSEINRELDPVTIKEQLVTNGKLNEAGGTAYLLELYDATPGVANITAYAEIVKERATLRRLIEVSQQIADRAFRPDGLSSEDLLNQAEQEIFDIAEGRLQGEGPIQANPLVKKAVQRVHQLTDTGSRVTGVSTGFTQLDLKTAGLQPSDLVIVAGRPSMGKTSFAMNLVEHAVMGDDKDGAVLVFSLEMPADLLIMRLLSSLGRIDQTRLRTGELKDQDWASLTSAVNLLNGKPLYIDDAPNLSPNDLRTRAHRVRRESNGKLKMIMVDYLQLMRGSGKSDNRTGEISEISRSLKALAKEMECPVIALSQLNRSLENRNDRRPVMADLRESGAIEQDADVIFFIYRDEVYNEQTLEQGIAEIIIGKQRNGPIGTVKLAFLNHLTKFENLAPERYEAEGFG
ncbi:MAG: replicative DNA helicase [Pseudomonadota bacterium]